MKIGGFQKMSLIDYPGKISSIVFTMGCNLRCPFCHVPQLVDPERMKDVQLVPEEEVFSFLKKNKDLVDAVVVTGGEPTLQSDLRDFIKKVKDMGFLVALETNGTDFETLKYLIDKKMVDYIGLDVKMPLEADKYGKITGGKMTKEMLEEMKKSVEYVIKSDIDYEFRTTLMKEFHTKEEVAIIAESIKGAKNYYLQNFREADDILSKRKFTPMTDAEMDGILDHVKESINVIKRE